MSNNVKKALINTSALYGKIVVNVIVAVITTKIVLQFLGEVDFGLFSLIGGVVAMLSFLNGALLQSTQRFLSIAIGEGNATEIRRVFNSGFMLHILMSVALIIVLIAAQPILFNGFLNIPKDRIGVAITTYYIVIITTVITFFTIPYNAAINAREEMWFFAITDILMSVMKFGAALAIIFIKDNAGNLLVIYTGGIMISTFIVLIIKVIWCNRRYSECILSRKMLWKKKQMINQIGFTGWNTLVTFAVVCRNQGVAIVLNVFFGPVINAAYGIANQINAVVSNFSTSISTVFAPQIIQSYGSDNKGRMLRLTIFSSKVTLLMSAVLGFPFLLESHTILKLWLSNIPEYASTFCNLTIILFIILQFVPGLTRALFAHGDIKWYQITVSLALIIPIVIGYVLFSSYNFQPYIIFYLMIIGQVITVILTVYFAKIKVGLNAPHFYLSSVLKPILVFIITYTLLTIVRDTLESSFLRLILISLISTILLLLQFYFFILNDEERNQFGLIFSAIKSRLI